SGFFDARDLVQVKYEMVRRVQVDGASVVGAAAAFGFSRPSYYEAAAALARDGLRSEEHTSELQSRFDLVCRLLLEKKKHRMQAHEFPLAPTLAICFDAFHAFAGSRKNYRDDCSLSQSLSKRNAPG